MFPINELFLSPKRLTVAKVLSKKVCYLSEMEESLPTPRRLKKDLFRVRETLNYYNYYQLLVRKTKVWQEKWLRDWENYFARQIEFF